MDCADYLSRRGFAIFRNGMIGMSAEHRYTNQEEAALNYLIKHYPYHRDPRNR
jgi:hypothetical protein